MWWRKLTPLQIPSLALECGRCWLWLGTTMLVISYRECQTGQAYCHCWGPSMLSLHFDSDAVNPRVLENIWFRVKACCLLKPPRCNTYSMPPYAGIGSRDLKGPASPKREWKSPHPSAACDRRCRPNVGLHRSHTSDCKSQFQVPARIRTQRPGNEK